MILRKTANTYKNILPREGIGACPPTVNQGLTCTQIWPDLLPHLATRNETNIFNTPMFNCGSIDVGLQSNNDCSEKYISVCPNQSNTTKAAIGKVGQSHNISTNCEVVEAASSGVGSLTKRNAIVGALLISTLMFAS